MELVHNGFLYPRETKAVSTLALAVVMLYIQVVSESTTAVNRMYHNIQANSVPVREVSLYRVLH